MGAIMVVDDEEDYLGDLARALSSKYSPRPIIKSVHPEEALHRLYSEPFLFDVVITDVEFPGSHYDGISLAQHIWKWKRSRQYSTRPKIICITGKSKKSTIENMLAVESIGGRFIDKDVAEVVERGVTKNLFLAIDRAIASLKEENSGPILYIRHDVGGRDSTSEKGKCLVGERIISATVFNEANNESCVLPVARHAPLLYLDCLCRKRVDYPAGFKNEDLAYILANDPFYTQEGAWKSAGIHFRRKPPKPISKNTVWNNLRRLSDLLGQALIEVNWPDDVRNVLVFRYYDFDTGILVQGPADIPEECGIVARPKRASGREKPPPGCWGLYSVRARVDVKHHPWSP